MVGKKRFYGSGLRQVVAAVAGLCLAAVLPASCIRDAAQTAPPRQDDNVKMTFQGLPGVISENFRIYAFDGDGPDRGLFRHRVEPVNTIDENTVSMTMPAGTWDIVMLTMNDVSMTTAADFQTRVFPPVVGLPRAGQKMYDHAHLRAGYEYLTSAPDLVLGSVDGKTILPNQVNTAEMDLVHSMALVRVVFKTELSVSPYYASTVRLHGVPTTLDWNGRLLPEGNPAVSSLPMTEFPLFFQQEDGTYTNYPCEFLVPAHTGDGSPADTTKCLLDISFGLNLYYNNIHSSYISERKTIPLSPKANHILLVNIEAGGSDVEITSDILPWEDTTGDVGISNPYTELRVSKGSVDLAPKTDQIVVTSNMPGHPSATPGADWLLVPPEAWAPDNRTLTLTGDPDSYDGFERTTYLDLALNNLTKRIPVRQQHVKTGTIGVTLPAGGGTVWAPDFATVVVSNTGGNFEKQIQVNTSPTSDGWRVSRGFLRSTFNDASNGGRLTGDLQNSTVYESLDGPSSGGNITIRSKYFPGGIDNGDYSIFENDTLRVHNTRTLEVAKVIIYNVYMAEDTAIGVGVPADGRDSTYVVDDANRFGAMVEVYGGTRQFVLDSLAPYDTANPQRWIKSVSCVANTNPATMADYPWVMQFTARSEGPNEELEPQIIKLRNADDPLTKVYVTVEPSPIATIPPFHYFSIRYSWLSAVSPKSGDDMDIAFRFVGVQRNDGTVPGWNNKSVGFAMQNNGTNAVSIRTDGTPSNQAPTDPNAQMLIEWAGDGLSNGLKEEVFFNAPAIDYDNTLPRKLTMEVWAVWYSTERTGSYDTYEVTVGGVKYYYRVAQNYATADPVKITISAYLGGTMSISNYGYINTGGERLNLGAVNTNNTRRVTRSGSARTFSAPTGVDGNGTAHTIYVHVCNIEYDRRLHSARVTWDPNGHAPEDTTTVITAPGRSELYTPPTAAQIEAQRRAAAEKEAGGYPNSDAGK